MYLGRGGGGGGGGLLINSMGVLILTSILPGRDSLYIIIELYIRSLLVLLMLSEVTLW